MAAWLPTDVKAAIIPVVAALLGWGGNTLIHLISTDKADSVVLNQHTQQINSLAAGQAKLTDTVAAQGSTLARIEGKVDVVNQKIDDDRRTIARGH